VAFLLESMAETGTSDHGSMTPAKKKLTKSSWDVINIYWLVVWNMNLFFHKLLGIILPID